MMEAPCCHLGSLSYMVAVAEQVGNIGPVHLFRNQIRNCSEVLVQVLERDRGEEHFADIHLLCMFGLCIVVDSCLGEGLWSVQNIALMAVLDNPDLCHSDRYLNLDEHIH